MRAVVFTGAGGDEVVQVVERPDPEPGPGEVVIAARYAGVNPADLLQREGRYPAPPGSPPDVPGLEVAGTVIARGPGAERFALGDRVLGIVGGGGLADRVVAHESALAPVPGALDERGAAAVPEVHVTAHDALVTRGGMVAGAVVVVRGATGGVGSAAVQQARALGARVIGVVRDDAASGFVAELGGVPATATTLADEVARLSDGRGADVVLELVGGDAVAQDVRLLTLGGRVVVVGVGAGARAELPLLELMARRASVHGTVLRARDRADKAAAVAAFAGDVLPLLADGRVRPVIERVLPLARAAEAIALLATPGRRGKVLLDLG